MRLRIARIVSLVRSVDRHIRVGSGRDSQWSWGGAPDGARVFRVSMGAAKFTTCVGLSTGYGSDRCESDVEYAEDIR
jgi:hypothetical protein